jgi:hypothetical protein
MVGSPPDVRESEDCKTSLGFEFVAPRRTASAGETLLTALGSGSSRDSARCFVVGWKVTPCRIRSVDCTTQICIGFEAVCARSTGIVDQIQKLTQNDYKELERTKFRLQLGSSAGTGIIPKVRTASEDSGTVDNFYFEAVVYVCLLARLFFFPNFLVPGCQFSLCYGIYLTCLQVILHWNVFSGAENDQKPRSASLIRRPMLGRIHPGV